MFFLKQVEYQLNTSIIFLFIEIGYRKPFHQLINYKIKIKFTILECLLVE